MKNLNNIFLIVSMTVVSFFITSALACESAFPQVGGSVRPLCNTFVDGGMCFLLFLGAAYGSKKLYS